jgi:hypothetical protein
MLTFKQLQTITKQEILKAFKDYFEVELKHPDPEIEWYTVQKTYVSPKTIKKIFKNRFETKNLKLDLRTIDTWAEIFLQCKEKQNCTLTVKEKSKIWNAECNKKVAADLEKLNFLLKEMSLKTTNRFASIYKAEGYNTRLAITGTKLEIGYGSFIVDAEFNSQKFLEHFQKTQRTFAIFERVVTKKYDANGYLTSIDDIKETEKSLVKFLTLEQLRVELPKILEKIKKAS